MLFKNKYFGIFITFINILIICAAIYFVRYYPSIRFSDFLPNRNKKVLGLLSPLFATPVPENIKTIRAPTTTHPVTPTSTLTPTTAPSPIPVDHAVSFVNVPSELMEGDHITFTWRVDGPQTTIQRTTVYYSTVSTPGLLTRLVRPNDTHYTEMVKEFLDGDYLIPLQFIGNTKIDTPGNYFARVYAFIDGKHYWSDERTFMVKFIPRNEISLIHYPKNGKRGENGVFTWEISGPPGTTSYTTIVIGRQSKPGKIDDIVDIAHTPYLVLVKDFISGVYNIPLRFVGNANLQESGNYYIRAYAWINGKNIWSDEHTITVE